jgi:hypothetical protein
MKRRTKILFALGLAVLLPLVVIFGFVGYHLVAGEIVERNFLSHELNREIFALNPNWDFNIPDVDVTSKLPQGINEAEFKTFLELSGYKCRQGNVCSADAGFNLVCDRAIVINGSFDVVHQIVNAKVRYHLTCL